MRIGINSKGELRFQNFEVSIDHSSEKQDTVQKITVAVDAIASLMVDYFDNEEGNEMPLVWQEYPFENEKIWLQFSSTNSDLESEANKLLGVKEEATLLVESTISRKMITALCSKSHLGFSKINKSTRPETNIPKETPGLPVGKM